MEQRHGCSDLLRCWTGSRYEIVSRERWLRSASRVAFSLRRCGVRPGDRVACLLSNSFDACAAVLGVWVAGGCIVSLPLPSRGASPAEYVRLLARIVATSSPTVLLCDRDVHGLLESATLGVPALTFAELGGAGALEPDLPDDHDVVFVQFSSGSTTQPRGCELSARAIASQLAALAHVLAIDPEIDTGAVWLPLAHDMGLFGCLMLSYWTDHKLVLSTPQRFMSDPGTWLEDCARFGATVSATPTFGLALASRVAEKRPPQPFPMRKMVVGGERIVSRTLRTASAALGPRCLPLNAVLPAYGLAEAVLAVTATPVGRGPRFVEVHAEALDRGHVRQIAPGETNVASVTLVSSGVPIPDARISVLSTAAAREIGIPDGASIGELVVNSASQAQGYFGDPNGTRRRFRPDGIHTGDLGFENDGELFVTGRLDDMLSFAGRNVNAGDVEATLAHVPGLRAGCTAVVETEPNRFVAVAELAAGHRDIRVIAEGIRDHARAVAGLPIIECVFLPSGRVPKTPSGKLRRFAIRELAQDAAPDDRIRVRL